MEHGRDNGGEKSNGERRRKGAEFGAQLFSGRGGEMHRRRLEESGRNPVMIGRLQRLDGPGVMAATRQGAEERER